MSSLIPFKDCIARPTEKGKVFLLTTHLLNVKEFMEKNFKDTDKFLARLMGLAGICHDAAKAHREWQKFISGRCKSRPNHAPEGAFLFSFLSYKMLKVAKKWEPYKLYWLWLARDLADHHGALKKISDQNWIGSGEWHKIDLFGFIIFIKQHYPELRDVDISEEILEEWAENIFDIIEDVLEVIDLGYDYVPPLELMKKLQNWRDQTTILIAGDRFDVTYVETSWFSKEDHLANDKALDLFCKKNQSQALSEVRVNAQQQILQQLKDSPQSMFYTLEMPTGYGKTITALKIATWLGLTKGYRKIVYVAPYLSILEQSSLVFEESMGRQAMEHHSLAILEPDKGSSDIEESLPASQLAMESWANAVVCTSFQQWSKALFPSKAQDTLRRAYLRDTVVVIDEPQIFSPESWNVFLCGLEALAELYNLRILFLSATMPPFTYGLTQEPVCLAVKSAGQIERYRIVRYGEMDEKQLAGYLLSREKQTQAAILNTIADSYQVYKQMEGQHPNLKLLHGMMIPLHKRVEIAKIQDSLKKHQDEPICVISTQVIEAGVDLSFKHVARALPILPSIIQAAGRVNRHFEGEQGVLSLFTFLRGGEKDTRGCIYNPALQKLTDKLLGQKEVWQEAEMLPLIKDYYHKMFEHNTFEAGKQAILDAYEGNWPELAKFQPFGSDYFKLPIFVPWHPAAHDRKWLPERFLELQKRLELYSPEEIYHCYKDKEFIAGLSFEKRRQLMVLFNHYVINIPVKLALTLVDREVYLQNKVPILEGAGNYDPVTGLAKSHIEGYDTFI